MTLPFERPIRFYASVTRDHEERRFYIGQAYQNSYGYWAETDAGTFPCDSIEEAIALVHKFMNRERRGIKHYQEANCEQGRHSHPVVPGICDVKEGEEVR